MIAHYSRVFHKTTFFFFGLGTLGTVNLWPEMYPDFFSRFLGVIFLGAGSKGKSIHFDRKYIGKFLKNRKNIISHLKSTFEPQIVHGVRDSIDLKHLMYVFLHDNRYRRCTAGRKRLKIPFFPHFWGFWAFLAPPVHAQYWVSWTNTYIICFKSMESLTPWTIWG